MITGADPANGYATLDSQPANDSYVVRDGAAEGNPAIPDAQAGRADRRRSLSYFGQLTDFQLADEESPARVEFTDQEPSGFAASAWRPAGGAAAVHHRLVDPPDEPVRRREPGAAGRRQPRGDGLRADHRRPGRQHAAQRDRCGRARCSRAAPLDPNSGSQNPADWDPLAASELRRLPADSRRTSPRPRSTPACRTTTTTTRARTRTSTTPTTRRPAWADWPAYPGLMDRAQLPFQAAGLDVPSYVTNGNHDGLVQGNQDGNAAFEDIATGCFKALGTDRRRTPGLDPIGAAVAVRRRRCSSRPTRCGGSSTSARSRPMYAANGESDAHGYGFVDEDENINSSFSAELLRLGSARGARLPLHLDRHALGGRHRRAVVEREHRRSSVPVARARAGVRLRRRQADRRLRPPPGPLADLERAGRGRGTVHAASTTRTATSPSTTTTRAATSTRAPRRRSTSASPASARPAAPTRRCRELLTRFPHVIAYVAGHTHENRIQPFTRAGGGVWWGIETSATADWPVQHRTGRGDGQPRRHAVDLRHGARRRV